MRESRLQHTLIVTAAVGFLSLAMPACGGDEVLVMATRPTGPLDVEVESDVPYTSEGALDVYYPDAPGGWPVAVVFHGGESHKETMRRYASLVAAQGVVVFVPEWRSFPRQNPDGFQPMLGDAACAMRFSRAHASEFGGLPGRVVTAGLSLGGNMAAIMVLAGDQFAGDCLVGPEVRAGGDGLVGLDAVYDFTEALQEQGRVGESTVEEMDQASAINYIEAARPGDDDIRFELFTGGFEPLHRQGERFRDGLIAAGYSARLTRDPGRPHWEPAWKDAPGTVDALVDMAFG